MRAARSGSGRDCMYVSWFNGDNDGDEEDEEEEEDLL